MRNGSEDTASDWHVHLSNARGETTAATLRAANWPEKVKSLPPIPACVLIFSYGRAHANSTDKLLNKLVKDIPIPRYPSDMDIDISDQDLSNIISAFPL